MLAYSFIFLNVTKCYKMSQNYQNYQNFIFPNPIILLL